MRNSMNRYDLSDFAGELDALRNSDADLTDEEQERYEDLLGLEKELGDLHVASRKGVILIHENDFEDYAMNQASAMVGRLSGWPLNCIDWDQAADELKVDYSEVDFDGDTYFYKS